MRRALTCQVPSRGLHALCDHPCQSGGRHHVQLLTTQMPTAHACRGGRVAPLPHRAPAAGPAGTTLLALRRHARLLNPYFKKLPNPTENPKKTVNCACKQPMRPQGLLGGLPHKGRQFYLKQPCFWVVTSALQPQLPPSCPQLPQLPLAAPASPCRPERMADSKGWHFSYILPIITGKSYVRLMHVKYRISAHPWWAGPWLRAHKQVSAWPDCPCRSCCPPVPSLQEPLRVWGAGAGGWMRTARGAPKAWARYPRRRGRRPSSSLAS